MEDGGRVTCVDKQGEEWVDLDMAVWKREWQGRAREAKMDKIWGQAGLQGNGESRKRAYRIE